MTFKTSVVYALVTVFLLTLAPSVQAQEAATPKPAAAPQAPPAVSSEANFTVTNKFTAQRRPRVTVFDFEDTNAEAKNARYGSSVEAMLVTFLKRKSQFVVVERQNRSLKRLLEEKQRIQRGMTQRRPGDIADRALLEKLDAYILGSVTLLNVDEKANIPPKPVEPAPDSGEPSSPAQTREEIHGPRIEIDAKLLSNFDGRIIAAAQRRGPVACLRSIVERLGIALEQEFLRPYYGKLRINMKEPENVRFFLTPILLDTALDEEKPPVERSASVTIGNENDAVVPWTTDPTTYTVDSLLSGWYSMRLERPGYEGLGVENARWVAKSFFGETELFDRVTNLPLDQTDSERRRFVVHVDALKTELVNGNSDPGGLSFVLHKLNGSLQPLVKRQYIDHDFTEVPRRAVLMGGSKIDLNRVDKLEGYADDKKCDLFDEQGPHPSDLGRTYIAAGQTFDLDNFTGGELIIEDYKGEAVPVGIYKMAFWEPNYHLQTADVTVRDKDQTKPTKTALVRETLPLSLETTGPRPASRGILEGRDTHYRLQFPLDFRDPKAESNLPVDVYVTSTNISGLDGWRHGFELLPRSEAAPVYDTASEKNKPKLILTADDHDVPPQPPLVKVKTRLTLGGRLSVLSRMPDPLAADVFIDNDLLKILNLLLYGHEERPAVTGSSFFKRASQAGESAVRLVSDTPAIQPPPQAAISQTTPAGGTYQVSGPLPGGKIPGPASNKQGAIPYEEAPKAPPAPPKLPHDLDALRKLLAQHLEVIDLLVLDPRDMAQLRRSHEVSAIVERYVDAGGALFAFVSEKGDYQDIVGAPFSLEKGHKSKRFEVSEGDVRDVVPSFEKKVKVKSKRALPELKSAAPDNSWRVIAFTKERSEPRLVERGKREKGGYVALWLDDPASYYGPLGGTVKEVEETRDKVEEHVMEWTHLLMKRRYDKSSEQAQPAAAAQLH
jgi:hypothetical protein